ncbi:MAG TPA: nitrate- and nitrite sensing domain-containing protein [Gammaproteobacteria bacterium]|nr:nitrate- and nitrite sensing domain-containing protein [Gammaproteobacteria bacterium]
MRKLFANASIKKKLTLLLLTPLVGLLFFSGKGTLEHSATVSDTKQLQTLSELSVNLSGLVHELQKERGASAGYLGSKGEKFGKELTAQHKEADSKNEAL